MPEPKSRKTELLALKNLGPTSVAMLNEIGVYTRADLENMGAVMAYRILKHQQKGITLNALYALHGALCGARWDQLSADDKARLRREAEEVKVSAGKAHPS